MTMRISLYSRLRWYSLILYLWTHFAFLIWCIYLCKYLGPKNKLKSKYMFYVKILGKKRRKKSLNKGLTSCKVSFHLTLCLTHDRDLTSGECQFGPGFPFILWDPWKVYLKYKLQFLVNKIDIITTQVYCCEN